MRFIGCGTDPKWMERTVTEELLKHDYVIVKSNRGGQIPDYEIYVQDRRITDTEVANLKRRGED